MTRKKVILKYIDNDASRKATFKKRKRGLVKKVCELSTLCGIDACAIIYSHYDAKPEVWPSPDGVQRVMTRFKSLPEIEQRKKMMTQETFLKQQLAKVKERLRKQQRMNRERELTCIMYTSMTAGIPSLDGLSATDLNDLGFLIDRNLKNITSRMAELEKIGAEEAPPSVPLTEEVNPVMGDGGEEWMMGLLNSNENLGFGGVGEATMMTPMRVVADQHLNCSWESDLGVADCRDLDPCSDPLWYRPVFFT